jgi:hypothetical protein
MAKKRLGGLCVITWSPTSKLLIIPDMIYGKLQCTMAYAATGHSDDKTAQIPTRGAFTIAKLACFVYHLIKGWKDVVCKLDFYLLQQYLAL